LAISCLKSRILSFSEEDFIMDAAKIQQAKTMAADPQITVPEICKTRGISRNTYYKYVRPAQVKEQQA
jgi:ACT domain-containing protein